MLSIVFLDSRVQQRRNSDIGVRLAQCVQMSVVDVSRRWSEQVNSIARQHIATEQFGGERREQRALHDARQRSRSIERIEAMCAEPTRNVGVPA